MGENLDFGPVSFITPYGMNVRSYYSPTPSQGLPTNKLCYAQDADY